MKGTKRTLTLLLAAGMTMGCFASCAPKGSEDGDEQTLQMYCTEAGYGTQWLNDLVDVFKEQAWVKEKYPNLTVEYPMVNDVRAFPASLLNAGQKTNKYDIIFGLGFRNYEGESGTLLDLTESVYNSEVPGESGVLFKDKMLDSFVQAARCIDPTDLDKEEYYFTNWSGGYHSFIYNKTILDSFGIAEPNTTDELIAACATIKANEGKDNGKYNQGSSILQSPEQGYWETAFPAWWAQYSGVDGYYDWWNGISGGRYSVDIFKEKGRLEALKVFEEILDYDKDYLNKDSFTYQFMQSQTAFLQGNAVFTFNGDWFANEMSGVYKQLEENGQLGGEFRTMALPVISALGEKLGITDAELSAMIDYVDGELADMPTVASTKGYTEEKILEAVEEARGVNYSYGCGHLAAIPEYATGKDVAIDFLRFMATDVANEVYAKATKGSFLPFEYNLKEKAPDTYNSLAQMTKDVQDIICSGLEMSMLPYNDNFPLNKYGGVTPFLKTTFYSTLAAQNAPTAQSLYDETLSAWTQEKFSSSLAKAGLI